MAVIRNEIDLILQATPVRVVPPVPVKVTWDSLTGKPSDPEIYNALAIVNGNLVPGFKLWTNHDNIAVVRSGEGWASAFSVNGTVLVMAAGNQAIPSYVIVKSIATNILYTLSFKATSELVGRNLQVDFYYPNGSGRVPSMPVINFTITPGTKDYKYSFVATDSGISPILMRIYLTDAKAGYILLGDMQLETGGIKTPWKPSIYDSVNIQNPINPDNYTSYMEAQSVSLMSFVRNSTALTTTGAHTVQLAFNSNGGNILAIVSGIMNTKAGITNGVCYIDATLSTVGGITHASGRVLLAPNTTEGVFLTWSYPVYIPNPGIGVKTYKLQVDFTVGGVGGSGQFVDETAIQLIGLKR